MAVNSEFKKLKKVLLVYPPDRIRSIKEPAEFLYRESIDLEKLLAEYEAYINFLKTCGIETLVFAADSLDIPEDPWAYANSWYIRDLFLMTPSGAVISSMAFKQRKNEPCLAEKLLSLMNIPVLGRISTENSFEAADALFLDEKTVLVAVGQRTDRGGFKELKELLRKQSIDCLEFERPSCSLHLLGSLQFVAEDSALVRTASVDNELKKMLEKKHIRIISVPENEDTVNRFAMNILIINPGEIIMPSGCGSIKSIYQQNGIKVMAEIPAAEMAKGNGAFACLTAVIEREL